MLFFPASLLKKHWEKWLRYQVLHIMFGPHTAINDDSMKSDKELIALENEIKQKVLKLEQRYIKRITEHRSGYEEYIANVFFNTLAAMYDPHTSFFSKNSYEQFKDMLSSEIYSFGIALEEDDYGNVYVVKVTPGGAAWKSSLIHINDVIKGLRWEGNEYIDMSNAGKQDIEYIMNLSNEGKLEFTLRKINGTEYSVWLQKEKIDNEENIVKSYVLSGEKKIGYISLPGFYTEWDNYNGNGCANDVAKEIVKLKEENIEGLIIRPSQ
jgi:carboxyl-terminal processing protease